MDKLENYITATEYARKIGRSPVVVTRKIRNGLIPEAVKIGTNWLVPANLEWINRHDKKISKEDRKVYKKEYTKTNQDLTNYIAISEMAKKHNISRELLYEKEIRNNQNPNFVKNGKYWYVDKNYIPKI